MTKLSEPTPLDRRQWQGAALFLISLLVFFVASIILYLLYAYWRRDDVESTAPLPGIFLLSTLSLVVISALVHQATRLVRRDRHRVTAAVLAAATFVSLAFLVAQGQAMWLMLESPEMRTGSSRGVAGMVVVLAVLHALHVVGGIVALALVAARCFEGRYDHERHGAVDFAAAYWHFLDLVWLAMLAAFWGTTGGFHLLP